MNPTELLYELYTVELATILAMPYIPRNSYYRKWASHLLDKTITAPRYYRLKGKLERFHQTTDLGTVI